MASDYDLVIVNGTLVSHDEIKEADIAIKDSRIAATGDRGSFKDAKTKRIIDAEGGWITPGGIDAHVHLQEPQLFGKGSSADTFETGPILLQHLYDCTFESHD